MNVPKLRFKEFNDDWKKEKLSVSSKIYDGTHETPNYLSNGIKFVSVENINNLYGSNKYISKKEYEKYKIKPIKNDVFMTRIGDIGTSTLYDGSEQLAYYVSLALIRSTINSSYINQYIKSPSFQKELYRKTIHVAFPKKINTCEIGECFISFGSFKEQEKIADFLSLVDKKIELQQKKVEALKLFKKGLLEILMNGNYETKKLSDILIKWNKRNNDNLINYVESVSNKEGFISQKCQFDDRVIASNDLRKYFVIQKNVFAYNPSRLNIGSLALKENDLISVVSPLYVCFTTNQNSKFLLEWFSSNQFKKEAISQFEGGVRNTLNFDSLCNIKISLPTIDKQNKIAYILSSFNLKVELEQKKLLSFKKYKIFLMQNMFI